MAFYRAARALLRARLTLSHLTEPNPRTPEKWEPRARGYIELANANLSEFGDGNQRLATASSSEWHPKLTA
jgi:aminoglycoside phosphotransferase family enzyme